MSAFFVGVNITVGIQLSSANNVTLPHKVQTRFNIVYQYVENKMLMLFYHTLQLAWVANGYAYNLRHLFIPYMVSI